MSPDGRCGECRHSRGRLYFDSVLRVGPYVDELRTLLRRFKFGNKRYLEGFLAELMGRVFEIAPWRPRINALVPVPTHWTRRFYPGFYPAEILARRVARRAHVPCLPLLSRRQLDAHQPGLALHERLANVRGAFRLKRRARIDQARLCIVDDVMTSGATVNEVAKVLKSAGAKFVGVLVLARADRQEENWQVV